jgi:ferredoxin
MPEVTKEVKLMLDPNAAVESSGDSAPAKFGAKDVFDLSWKNLLDAYTCTECGRCTAQCPANLTGKLLLTKKLENNPENTIATTSLSKGMYLVSLETKNGTSYTTKLIIE